MNILIFDFEITGHHPEYIEHLVDYIIDNNHNNKHSYNFVVHPDFTNRFSRIVSKVSHSPYKFITIKESELANLYKSSNSQKVISPYKAFNLLAKYAKEINPDKCILMYFNYFSLPLMFKRPKFKIDGIYFSPFTRAKANFNLKYFKKRLLFFLYAQNKKIKKIFILNDHYSVERLNKLVFKNIFNYLPDPIPAIEEESEFNIREKYNISNSKKILLHFGSLRDSKGTIELIQALNYLPNEVSSQCCLIIAGRPKDSYIEKKIQEQIDRIKDVEIKYINDFFSNNQMKSLFKQSDIIVIPYKNALASSGIIGHAIISNKPVISTKHGLIGELIKQHWKGELIDKVEPLSIAIAIENSIYSSYPEIDSKNYQNEHTPSNFAQTILYE